MGLCTRRVEREAAGGDEGEGIAGPVETRERERVDRVCGRKREREGGSGKSGAGERGNATSEGVCGSGKRHPPREGVSV